MDLILVAIAVYVIRDVWNDINTKRRDSRAKRIGEREKQLAPHKLSKTQRRSTAVRHDLGWWLREVFSGFPVATSGLRAGWIAHQVAAHQQQAIVDEHKGRLARIRQLATQAPGGQPRERWRQVHVDDPRPASVGQPGEQPPEQPAEQQPAPQPASPPEPPAAGISPVPAVGVPPAADPAPAPAPRFVPVLVTDPPPIPTNGVRTMPAAPTQTEFPYQRTIAVADQLAVGAEQMQADLANFKVPEMVDELSSGAIGLDGGSLGRLDDMHQAYETVAQGMKSLTEKAQSFRDGLQRDHGNVNEAHQDAPEGGAEKAFYREG